MTDERVISLRAAAEQEQIRARIINREGSALHSGGGGGTYDGMDPWQQTVEARLASLSGKIDTNLRWLLIAFASGFLALGGLVISRSDNVVSTLGVRLDTIAQKVDSISDRVSRMEGERQARDHTS